MDQNMESNNEVPFSNEDKSKLKKDKKTNKSNKDANKRTLTPEEKKKEIFKFLNKLWVLAFLLWLVFFINFESNEIMIRRYNRGEYKENPLAWMGVLEPYVSPYNLGNMYYQQEKYDMAILEYEKALTKNPPKYKECKIRINLALARLKKIDFDNIDDTNRQEIIKELKDIKTVLTDEECAHEEDDNGHSQDAQQLKNEIDDLIDQLENPNGGGSNGSDDNNHQQSTEESTENDEVKQELQQLQEQAIQEREEEIEQAGDFLDFDIYYGDEW